MVTTDHNNKTETGNDNQVVTATIAITTITLVAADLPITTIIVVAVLLPPSNECIRAAACVGVPNTTHQTHAVHIITITQRTTPQQYT